VQILTALNELGPALLEIQKVVAFEQRTGGVTSHTYQALGETQRLQGQLDAALLSFRRALDIDRSAFPAGSLVLAMRYHDLTRVLRQLKQYQEAIQYRRDALQIEEQCLPADHPQLGSSYYHLAMVQLEMGQREEAFASFRKSLAILIRGLGEEHPNVVETRETMRQAGCAEHPDSA
jgi:tetratricopeptide (TPR) repeat protein